MDDDAEVAAHEPVSIALFLDDGREPYAVYRPPATANLDTSKLDDGEHRLHIEAVDASGRVGRRTIRFRVANGPGISVTGLRDGKSVAGNVEFRVNAFGGSEPFDTRRAESQNPIPVWVWVMIVVISGWAGWYGLENLATPAAFAATPTYATNPGAIAVMPVDTTTPAAASGKSLSGFDYGAIGANGYATNCAACHGVAAAGVPGAFPSLVKDPVVEDTDPREHILTVLHGLHGKKIGGASYSSQMPAFPQLSDADIAAIIDHERTTWGNTAPTILPSDVKKLR